MSEDDNDDAGDLTSLEDLGEFLHQNDPDLDAQLDGNSADGEDQALAELNDLEDSEDSFAIDEEETEEESDPPPFDKTPELPEEAFDENTDVEDSFPTLDDSQDDSELETEAETDSFEATEPDMSFGDEETEEDESSEESLGESSFGDVEEPEAIDESETMELAEEFAEESEDIAEESPLDQNMQSDSFDSESFEEDQPLDTSDDDFTAPEEEFEAIEEEEEQVTAFEESDTEIQPIEEEVVEATQGDQNQELAETLIPIAKVEESPAPQAVSSASRENFKDLKEFGESISYGSMALGGNPPFSVIIKGIKYLEDSEDILIILREHGLVTDENEAEMEKALANGCILISQISEYSAIYLAHRIRRFEVEVLLGLSEELHPSKAYEGDQKGLINKENLKQNQKEALVIEEKQIELESIILTTTPSLEGYIIQNYIGLATEHTIVDEDELERMHLSKKMEDEIKSEDMGLTQHLHQEDDDGHRLVSTYGMGLIEIYQDLAEELRTMAFKRQGNAVVGITYQLTPLLNHSEGKKVGQYKVTCTGNIVWVVGQGDF
ncbi:MAG: hypothetical protein HN509_06220 [Halobacteriovoraceae bacterium]|jgi:hypothetical protein|nr:hypothetical protein [Halobacteriovoraceae bacterium]MBT5094139.1 hypothetical protein [Halobacteriovoraceae bacterium]